jgi:hypothetical protein
VPNRYQLKGRQRERVEELSHLTGLSSAKVIEYLIEQGLSALTGEKERLVRQMRLWRDNQEVPAPGEDFDHR